MKKFLTLFVLAVTLVSNAQESVLLRLNYEKGAKYTMKMDMTQEMGPAGSMSMKMKASIDIVDANKGVYTTKTKFTKVAMDMFVGGQIMSFDSDMSDDDLDESAQQMKAQMEPMLKAVIFTKTNNLGKVLEIKAEPDFPGSDQMAKQSSNIVYPEKSVKVGSTWNMEQENQGMKMNFIYTVKSILKDKVILDISGEISGLAEGTITGKINVGKKSGLPLKSKIDMTMSVSGQEMKSTVAVEMIKM